MGVWLDKTKLILISTLVEVELGKKHWLHDFFKFYSPTLAEVYSQQNLMQVLLGHSIGASKLRPKAVNP